MSLANSTYLFGLLGFIVPIIIHLLNKKEGKVMAVGSIQFMPEAESTHSRSLHLNEYILLLLRCLILALISILMAGWLLPEKEIDKKAVVLVDPSISNDSRVIRALDTLDNYEKRWLQNGLPNVKNVAPDTTQLSSIWGLIKQVNQLNADTITVFSSLNISRLKGKRPVTNKIVKFIGVGELDSKSYLFQAFKTGVTQKIIVGNTNTLKTEYKLLYSSKVSNIKLENDSISWNKGAKIAIREFDTLHINIIADKGFERDQKYLEAALRAISSYLELPVKIDRDGTSDLSKEGDWIFWLSAREMPVMEGKILSFQENRFEKLISKNGKSDYHLNQRLNSNNTIEQNLTSHMLDILFDFDQIDLNDSRQVAVGQIMPKFSNEKTSQGSIPANQHWLWLVLGVLFFVERTLSMVRNQ